MQILTIHFETLERMYFPCVKDCPVKFKNKNFNFDKKLFITRTYNKTEDQIQQEFKVVQERYQKYLKSQEAHPDGNCKQRQRLNRKPKGEYYPVTFTSDTETLHFKTSKLAANHFGITVNQISVAKRNKKYTKTTFLLISKDGIIDEAKNLKQLALQNNQSHNMYRKVLSGEKKSYFGNIVKRKDVVYSVG